LENGKSFLFLPLLQPHPSFSFSLSPRGPETLSRRPVPCLLAQSGPAPISPPCLTAMQAPPVGFVSLPRPSRTQARVRPGHARRRVPLGPARQGPLSAPIKGTLDPLETPNPNPQPPRNLARAAIVAPELGVLRDAAILMRPRRLQAFQELRTEVVRLTGLFFLLLLALFRPLELVGAAAPPCAVTSPLRSPLSRTSPAIEFTCSRACSQSKNRAQKSPGRPIRPSPADRRRAP